jgi:hypothetical protein
MALEGSTGFGLGTLRFKLATVAGTRGRNILIVLSLFIKIASFQGLAGRTGKGVGFSMIGESLLSKDTLLICCSGF